MLLSFVATSFHHCHPSTTEHGKIRTHFVDGSDLAGAGIYVVGPEIFRGVPAHTRIDMPELLEGEIANRRRVLMFPIHEYWLDIGRMDDFERAQTDFHALGLT